MIANLSELTSLRLGGPPGRLVKAMSEQEAVEVVRQVDRDSTPLLILGGGSNVVVSDDGFPGTVMLMAETGTEQDDAAGDVVITAKAGQRWDDLVAQSVAAELSGIECLSGIPGSAGAAPIQNIGAYGQDVSDSIASVRVYDRRDGVTREISPEECLFGYRDSRFKRLPGRHVILAVSFRLSRSRLSQPVRYPQLAEALGVSAGERAPLDDVRLAVLELRRQKGLLASPAGFGSASAGSFFTNPLLEAGAAEKLRKRVHELLGEEVEPPLYPQSDGTVKTSAAWLIERAGFARGYGNPEGIAISSLHTLVLTNRGKGSTSELLALAREIANGVLSRFAVSLQPEPVLVGVSWDPPG